MAQHNLQHNVPRLHTPSAHYTINYFRYAALLYVCAREMFSKLNVLWDQTNQIMMCITNTAAVHRYVQQTSNDTPNMHPTFCE